MITTSASSVTSYGFVSDVQATPGLPVDFMHGIMPCVMAAIDNNG
jgi:hypothetical protein